MKNECTETERFPITLLTEEEHRTMLFWCPKVTALIDESNRLGVIALWNAKPGKKELSPNELRRALQFNPPKAA